MTKYVYSFEKGKADGNKDMRELLGGKGANLAEMAAHDLPVPAGFTITTEVCTYFYEHGKTYPESLKAEVEAAMKGIEAAMGKKFGDTEDLPLLVSCRSGARESMPGMMDTVLNIGLNDKTVRVLAEKSGSERYAWDCYRRFVQMFGDVVLEMKPTSKTEIDPFEKILVAKKAQYGVNLDSELPAEALKELVTEFKAAVKAQTGKDFPEDPMEQVWAAIGAVFGSWMNDRAIVYRRTYSIPHTWGTAVNVQAMVFGNMGDDCATGVALTRDGATGVKGITGDYLINAQGEDVVAGIRRPKKIEISLREDMPEVWEQFQEVALNLEKAYHDVQDIEFTIEKKKLYMLQTRNAKRTGFAHVRTAVEMCEEGLIDKKTAVKRVPAGDVAQLLQPIFSGSGLKGHEPIAKGVNAGPGAATGQICFQPDEAEKWFQKDKTAKLILVRRETTPEDLRGMQVAQGIVTSFGGAASHAALVSRQLGKACVCGCDGIIIDYAAKTMTVGDKVFHEGDWISVDGFTGNIYGEQIPTAPSEVLQVLCDKTLDPKDAPIYQLYAKLMGYADEFRTLKIRTNADKPAQATQAVALGAEGIGLTRTEHMFFDHIDEFRAMILADNTEAREKALEKLLPFQQADFEGLFTAMDGKYVTIRLLDPPLHEFLPHDLAGQQELAAKTGMTVEFIQQRVDDLAESNPMLGHRGCRLGIVYPEITKMQATAIIRAAIACQKKGIVVKPEIMIPLVTCLNEFANQEAIIRAAADAENAAAGDELKYMVGTMIEIPRAALNAGDIAKKAEFFSFGTNDLTQTCLGISRD
ncbi:MAG: pyruvate, phosphate dikinase, partial [Thermoguttaceae bacterium]|nr:pyruvate, phosphate dikinase [Thermoguttaceae bacterium]